MLISNAGRSESICDGFRKRCGFNVVRGFLPLVALMLLATPQLVFANGPVVTVNPDSLVIAEEGTAQSYTIELETEPTEDVTITVVLPDPNPNLSVAAGTRSTGSGTDSDGRLTFTFMAPTNPDGTGGNWDEVRDVNVTAGDDANAVSERVSITHEVSIDDENVPVRNVTVRVTVQDNDLANKRVIVSETIVTPTEADASGASYNISIGTQPTGIVTIDVKGTTGEITVSPSRLFITPDNWEDGGSPRTFPVTVYAGKDPDAELDKTTLTHTVRGADYTGVAAAAVEVEVAEADTRGVTLSTLGLRIEELGTDIYTVKLDSKPTRSVYVDVSSSSSNVTVSPKNLTFSTGTWNDPRPVTVTVKAGASGTVNLTHEIRDSGSRDEEYDQAPFADPNGTVNNVIGVTVVTATTGLTLSPASRVISVNESATKTYTVRLSSPGTGTVVIASRDPDRISVSHDPLTFTNETTPDDDHWNKAKTITVTAAEDSDAEDEEVVLTHALNSGDIITTMRVRINDNDSKGVTISPPSLEITEGSTGVYTVGLDTEPTGPVTVTITGASGDVTVDPSQLTFSPGAGWRAAQRVEVEVERDLDAEQDVPVTLKHTVRGADYEGQKPGDVKVSIRELDTKSINVEASTTTPSELTVPEGGFNTYDVWLNSQPTGTVTVRVGFQGASGDVTVNPSRLTFTTSNWNIRQDVEVSAAEDVDAEQDAAVTLRHSASGGGYDNVTGGMIAVTITENPDQVRTKGVTVSPKSLTVMEGGPSRGYTVVLTSEPTGQVRITIGGLALARAQSLDVKPTTLSFQPNNWDVPQTVTVRADEDANATGHAGVMLTHTPSGGGYDGITVDSVSVTVRDNDTSGITVDPESLEIAEGKRESFTVVLDADPGATVTVNVDLTTGTGLTLSPSPETDGSVNLEFDSGNWDQPQTVWASAGVDADTEDATGLVITISATAAGYPSRTVAVAIRDTNAKGVVVSPASLRITEGTSKTYSLVLTQKPSATVRISVSGASGDVTVSPTSRSFSTTSWNQKQTVRVSVRDDRDAVDDAVVTLRHKVSGGDYDDVTAGPVEVNIVDDDERGVTVTPTSLTVAPGASASYRVRLNSEPTDAVSISVESPRSDVSVNEGRRATLDFTTSNWDDNQTVTVSVDADAGDEEEQFVTLTHSVVGGDYHHAVDVPSVSVTIPVEGAPGQPRNLTAEAGNGQVVLSWTAPAKDGGSAILRYEVRYRESGGSYGGWTAVSGGGSATTHTVRGLDNGTSYEFQIRAVNAVAAGQPAEAEETLPESAPGAPSGLSATGGDGSVTLNWSAPVDGGSQIIRYEYRYAATGQTFSAWETASGAGNARSVTIGSLTNGTEYRFQVRAVNEIGEGPAATASATPGRAPTAPTGLTAKSEDEAITVMWGMPTDNGGSAITGYQVRYRMNGGQWSNWMTVSGGANATSYTLTGLTNGIGHEIAVRAENAIGSGASATIEATPMEPIDFAHFGNGTSDGVTMTSDIVLVNIETSAVNAAIYFYNQKGEMIDADSVVDVSGDLAVGDDGSLSVPMIRGQGEITISTNGEGSLVVGSVRVFGTGRLGGVLRFDIPAVGVAGVGASEPVSDAIFPARRMARGINTGAAIRNLSDESLPVTCYLMQDGEVVDTAMGPLVGNGHVSLFIDQLFPGSDTTDFVGSVRCTADDGMFAGVALEMDDVNGIFTTLPLVPLDTESDDGESMLNFAHFANGDFSGTAMSSDLVFINVATSAVTPAIYFYDQDGEMISADMVVDTTMAGVDVGSDGALMVMDEIPPMGEMTISTSGMGDGIIGSVRVVSDGPIGGVLRFVTPNIGVAGVGASEAVNAAVFPARRMADGINTGAAIRNLMADGTTVTCRLMSDGQTMGETPIRLKGNGQSSLFIHEIFPDADTDDFEGSVRCTAPSGSMFTGVALEMDFNNRIFTTLPVIPVQ